MAPNPVDPTFSAQAYSRNEAAGGVEITAKQAAAVALRSYVKKAWDEDSKSKTPTRAGTLFQDSMSIQLASFKELAAQNPKIEAWLSGKVTWVELPLNAKLMFLNAQQELFEALMTGWAKSIRDQNALQKASDKKSSIKSATLRSVDHEKDLFRTVIDKATNARWPGHLSEKSATKLRGIAASTIPLSEVAPGEFQTFNRSPKAIGPFDAMKLPKTHEV